MKAPNEGGIYSVELFHRRICAAPAPKICAILLAGLGLMGAIASKRKTA